MHDSCGWRLLVGNNAFLVVGEELLFFISEKDWLASQGHFAE